MNNRDHAARLEGVFACGDECWEVLYIKNIADGLTFVFNGLVVGFADAVADVVTEVGGPVGLWLARDTACADAIAAKLTANIAMIISSVMAFETRLRF